MTGVTAVGENDQVIFTVEVVNTSRDVKGVNLLKLVRSLTQSFHEFVRLWAVPV